MGIFKPEIDIGKVIAGRVKGFPVGEKKPKKKARGKDLTCWVICPSFRVKSPKVIDQAEAGKDYSYLIMIYSTTRTEVLKALDYMIRCGKEEIEDGNKRFWLHATTYGIQHRALFSIELRYTFRVRQIPEQISKEVK